MKRIKWAFIIVGLLFLVSCGGGGGGGHSNPVPSHAPDIEDVCIYYWDTYYGDYFATDEVERGDDWYYDITFSDEGMDAEKVTMTQYYPIDSDIPVDDASIMILESQTAVRTRFYQVEDYTVPYNAQLGTSRFDFQIEDRAGNKSAVFSKFLKVTW